VYPQVTGSRGVTNLAQACDEAAAAAGARIGFAPPQVEVATVGRLGLEHLVVFAQHCDALAPGSGTGWTTPEAIKAAGAVGSILNHAEHKISHGEVGATVERLRALGLSSLVCADGDAEVRALAALTPTYLAIEPPELIGGAVSVTSADPAVIERNAVAIRRAAPLTLSLCGAGIKTARDVSRAIELGCHGVLLASGVVKSRRPRAVLDDLCSGLP
jgi:triosephosphate isomerase